MEPKVENQEGIKFIHFGDAVRKLGQVQYSSRLVNPDPRAHDDGTPYFDDIRIKGDPDNYHGLEICEDDVRKFIEKWFEYKKASSPFFGNQKLEDYL
jgi:hypothetical protein